MVRMQSLSSEMVRLTQATYGTSVPSVFESIEMINKLLEKSNTKWSNEVHSSFNSSVRQKMHDKSYWDKHSGCKENLDEETKQLVIIDLMQDLGVEFGGRHKLSAVSLSQG